MKPVSYWNPMATAPKDGTKLIGLLIGGDVSIIRWMAIRKVWISNYNTPRKPIGWIEVPRKKNEEF